MKTKRFLVAFGALALLQSGSLVQAATTLADGLDATNLVWTTGGTGGVGWSYHAGSGVGDDTFDGIASAQSGHISDNGETWIQTTVVGPGTVSFWWDAYSEPNADWLEFYLNASLQARICGGGDGWSSWASGWQYCSFPVPAGTNVLKWRYAKDASSTGGTIDTVWVDRVSYVPAPPPPLQQALNTSGVLWSSSGSVYTNGWFAQTNITHDGQWAAQSGAAWHNQTNWLQATVSGTTYVSFWWKVSSEQAADFLEFYTNGVLARQISGEVNWQSNYFRLPATTNVLTWLYRRDALGTAGSNCGWLDQVGFSAPLDMAATTTTIASSKTPSSIGDPVSWTATVSASTPGAGTPSGTVQFRIDGTNFDGLVALSGGSGTSLAIATLAVGSHTITAVYSGDGSFNTNTSVSFTQTVSTSPVTPATGGNAISADATGGAYTSLTGPVYAETSLGAVHAGTIILNAPDGFFFDTGAPAPTVKISGSATSSLNVNDAVSGTAQGMTSVTTTQLTFTVTAISAGGGTPNILTWQNVRVRPTAGTPLASGNITKTGTSTMSSVATGANFGFLAETAGAASKLVVQTQPSATATAGMAFTRQPAVQIQDQFGNARTFANRNADNSTLVTAARSAGTAALQGTLTATAANGLASFSSLSYNKAETITLQFTGGSLASALSTTFMITPRPVTVTAAADEKVYDGTTTSTGVPIITAGSLMAGDTAVFTQAFNSKDVLTAHLLIPFGSVNDGNGGNNYAITFSNIVTHSIMPKALTVTAAAASRVYGAPNPVFTPSYSGFVPGEDASVLSGSPSLSTTAASDSPVSGSPYPITVVQNTLTNPNYSLEFASGNLRVTPASATVGVASDKGTVVPNDSVTLAVSVVANAPSTATPSGSVQFVANGTNNLGSPITLINGQATLTVLGSALAHGSNTITAIFSSANGNFNACSGDLNPALVVSGEASNISPVILSLARQPEGSMEITASGMPGKTYQIQASENLGAWATIGSNTVDSNGKLVFLDQNATNYASRFYRLAAP